MRRRKDSGPVFGAEERRTRNLPLRTVVILALILRTKESVGGFSFLFVCLVVFLYQIYLKKDHS